MREINSLDALQQMLAADGCRCQRSDDELFFTLGIGEPRLVYRVFQSGFILVLLVDLGIEAFAERKPALVSYCNDINFGVLAYGCVEARNDGGIQFRQCTMLPTENTPSPTQLRWFIGCAASVAAVIAHGAVKVVQGSDPLAAAAEVQTAILMPSAKA